MATPGRPGLGVFRGIVPMRFVVLTFSLLPPLSMIGLTTSLGDPLEWEVLSSMEGDLEAPNSGSQQTCCVAADIDGDGRQDFIVGERTHTPSVVWYRSDGRRWHKRVIDNSPLKPEAGGVCWDVDADGDLDLVLGQDASGPNIWWWENPNPHFDRPWKRRLIKDRGPSKHHDQTVGDFDGDGRAELVTWNQKAKQLLLYRRPADPRQLGTWKAQTIFQWKTGPEMEGFPSVPVDVDQDGQVDIVGGGRWFKHRTNGRFDEHVIDDRLRFTQCAAGQLVRGGRPEIVFSPGDVDGEAKWYQWDGKTWVAHSLAKVIHGHTCDVKDINGDGNADILIGEMGSPGAGDAARVLVWYGDGMGTFLLSVISKGQGIHEGLLADLDGDGDLDLLRKPYHHHAPRIDVLLNPRH